MSLMLFDPLAAAIHTNLLINTLLPTLVMNHAILELLSCCAAAMNACFCIIGRLMSWLTDCELFFFFCFCSF